MKLVRTFFQISIFVLLLLISFVATAHSTDILTVEAENFQADMYTNYHLDFQTSVANYFKVIKGEFVVTIPNGFDTDSLVAVDVVDEFKHFSYIVKEIVVDGNYIHLYLKLKINYSLSDFESDYPYASESTYKMNISIILSKIRNPVATGSYQISLEGRSYSDNVVIGPLISNYFDITEVSTSKVASIIVSPSEELHLQAGDSQQFSATAFDKYGNQLDGIEFQWSLYNCTDCIGEFSDSTLFVHRVGQGVAKATADEVSGFSGQIKVTPGPLATMVLQVGTTQFVNYPINHDAAVILYDEFNNLKTDYNLSENPIELIISNGELNNYYLDNNEFQIGGVVRILPFDIRYTGLSGMVSIQADNGLVNSNIRDIYFNNYDIVDVQDIFQQTISTIHVGTATPVSMIIQNNGNLKADGSVTVSYFWLSQINEPHNSLQITIPEIGESATLQIDLPVLETAGVNDELIVSVESNFLTEGVTTTSEKHFQVEVVEPIQLLFVPDSFKPDTLINNISFDVSFDVDAQSSVQQIDSTLISISIFDKVSNQLIADVFDGSVNITSINDGVLSYRNISAVLHADNTYPNGWYNIQLDYNLFSGDELLTLPELIVDSVYIYFDHGISLVPGSLSPRIVYAGTNVSFEFKININSDQAYAFHKSLSHFRIFDENYSSTTNLFIDRDSLYPGENILRSASISIQPEQVGSNLMAEADFKFCLPGQHDTLMYVTDFTDASLPITVEELPLVQILDLIVVSPNAPIVNSSQNIQFKAIVASHSSTIIDSVSLELKTIDHLSTIGEPIQTAYNIQPYDTVEIFFNVTASETAQTLPESFRVDVANNSIGSISPVNNSAYLIIETEAMIELSYRVNGIENAQGYAANYGDNIHIQVDVSNKGTATVTNGSYYFIVEGINGANVDTMQGTFSSDSTIEYNFITPFEDTELKFNFEVTTIPLDLNYNAPAKLMNPNFDFSVFTVSNTAELIIEPIFLGSNLVLPGRSKELFDLVITNNSNSSLNSIQLDFVDLNLFTSSHDSLDVRDILIIANTYFTENNQILTTTTSGGNELKFWFTNFVIGPQESRTIRLIADFKTTDYKSVILEIPQTGVIAKYFEGPNVDQNVTVTSLAGGNKILSYEVALKGNNLEESFIIQDNPFNPNIRPVQFTFELSEEAPVEFQVFSLTGELVYEKLFQPGTVGASVGENIISWDGCNNSGKMVLNGVYIASIVNKGTGDYARIKVAVVK